MFIKHFKSSFRGRKGVTLVELLVAGVIIIVAVFAVIAVVRKSTDMQVNDYHRRQARAIIMNMFETVFTEARYNANLPYILENDEEDESDDLIFVLDETVIFNNIVIDQRVGGNNPLTGTMTVLITPENINVNSLDITTNIPTHFVSISLCWNTSDGTQEELVLTKRLAKTL
ncbi:MAG: hypothetical protein LBI42_03245 [Chitinispirillales bacterium]|jgi:Tfp pilus assembly protein PilE|nr:hypothetical protein [Chitinispirillales bacterium]